MGYLSTPDIHTQRFCMFACGGGLPSFYEDCAVSAYLTRADKRWLVANGWYYAQRRTEDGESVRGWWRTNRREGWHR